jgi:hypothetical protein
MRALRIVVADDEQDMRDWYEKTLPALISGNKSGDHPSRVAVAQLGSLPLFFSRAKKDRILLTALEGAELPSRGPRSTRDGAVALKP